MPYSKHSAWWVLCQVDGTAEWVAAFVWRESNNFGGEWRL